MDNSFILLHVVRIHKACEENMIETKAIWLVEWAACFSDLNPIEHVRDTLGQRNATRKMPLMTMLD